MSVLDKEEFAVVDENDKVLYNVVGKKTLHSLSKGCYHRSAHLLIEAPGGRMVLQLKAEGTENAGKWSSAVSGHVAAKETYTESIIREAKEELGLQIPTEELDEIALIRPCEETGWEFVALYTYLMDDNVEVIKPNYDEIDELAILKLNDIIKDMNVSPEKYSPAFTLSMNLFLTVYKI